MTDLTLTVNSISLSAMIEKGSYITDLIPVVGSKYTDLNKVDHTIIARYKGYVEVTLNPMSPATAKGLYDQLIQAPCRVTYYSFQKKTEVTASMIPEWDSLKDAMRRSTGHWVQSIKLSFTEE